MRFSFFFDSIFFQQKIKRSAHTHCKNVNLRGFLAVTRFRNSHVKTGSPQLFCLVCIKSDLTEDVQRRNQISLTPGSVVYQSHESFPISFDCVTVYQKIKSKPLVYVLFSLFVSSA